MCIFSSVLSYTIFSSLTNTLGLGEDEEGRYMVYPTHLSSMSHGLSLAFHSLRLVFISDF